MFHNIAKASFWLIATFFTGLCAVALLAQETPAPATTAKPMHPKTTVTGCLQKGDAADEFAITGEDGKTWELRSSTVKLTDHVGHQVTVTGAPTRETKAEERKEKKEGSVENAAGKERYGELRVTDWKMVR